MSLSLVGLHDLGCFSHVQLCATPWTAACQAPPTMGFSMQEYWSGLPLPSLAIMKKVAINKKKKTWFLLTSTQLWSQLTFLRPPGWARAAWLLRVFSWDVGYLLQALSYPCGFHPPPSMQPRAARTLNPGPQALTASSDTNTNWRSCAFQCSFVYYLANSSRL